MSNTIARPDGGMHPFHVTKVYGPPLLHCYIWQQGCTYHKSIGPPERVVHRFANEIRHAYVEQKGKPLDTKGVITFDGIQHVAAAQGE